MATREEGPGLIGAKDRLALGVALFAVLTAARVEAEPPKAAPTPSVPILQLLHHLGFAESQQSSLFQGKVLSTGLPDAETEKNELAVAAVVLYVRRPLAEVVEAYMDGEIFRLDPELIEFREFDQSSGSDAIRKQFDDLGYTSTESAEARKIIKFKGGSAFNLSEHEIELFGAINRRDAELVEHVSATWREVLADRLLAYQARGLEAIDPYKRSGKKRDSPGKELIVATASMAVLRDFFPDLYDAVLIYPEPVKRDSTPVEHRFFWLKQRLQNRPNFVLSHHAADFDDDYAIVLEQQFYVSHSYNCMEGILGCVAHNGGTIVFFTNRTFTDQVTGFAAGIARSIGRSRIEKSVSEQLERLRTTLESRNK